MDYRCDADGMLPGVALALTSEHSFVRYVDKAHFSFFRGREEFETAVHGFSETSE
jgi:hypothetical protein